MTVSRKKQLLQEAIRLQKEKTVKEELPHLFRIKKYDWMIKYEQSTNRMKFICAGNQIGKSTIQIIHAIDLATDKKKWKKFFLKREPQVFWYIYPSKAKIQEEYKEKWVKENLPRGEMKDHPVYGWKKFHIDGEFAGISFNSGVSIYFKSWGVDLQAGTCDAIFCDEEMPSQLYPELAMRLSAYDGMFSMVFTATLNQDFWFDVIEKRGKHDERFPGAFKLQVSLEHDCRYFADGTPSHFTLEEVNKRKNKIGDPTEIDRRIHGRFVSSRGKKFVSFNKLKNVKAPMPIPNSWEYYAGVDIGTGGKEGHPAAISIIAVRPDYKYGRLIKFWKGNKNEYTTTTDILNKYIEMTNGLTISRAFYDWHSKDFALRAQSSGIPFEKAEKSHAVGDDLLNSLFKNQMFDLELCEQVDELVHEFETVKHTTRKADAKDDGIDSVRYAVSSLSWDFSDVTSDLIEMPILIPTHKTEVEIRAENAMKMHLPPEDDWDSNKDIEFYNDLMDEYYGE